jgi:hypothetical protein
MHRKTFPTLAIGLFGGFALGVAARAWMRLISTDPEFSWNGTLFIVLGFTLFGLAQAIVAVVRSRSPRRWKLTVARTIGGVFMLPLFGAAGALMMPTVVGAGLGSVRVRWHPVIRGVCFAIATLPVLLVLAQLVDGFGWSLHTAAGFVVMLAIYTAIIAATRFTFAQQEDGWRPSPRLITTLLVIGGGVFIALFVAGGGFK